MRLGSKPWPSSRTLMSRPSRSRSISSVTRQGLVEAVAVDDRVDERLVNGGLDIRPMESSSKPAASARWPTSSPGCPAPRAGWAIPAALLLSACTVPCDCSGARPAPALVGLRSRAHCQAALAWRPWRSSNHRAPPPEFRRRLRQRAARHSRRFRLPIGWCLLLRRLLQSALLAQRRPSSSFRHGSRRDRRRGRREGNAGPPNSKREHCMSHRRSSVGREQADLVTLTRALGGGRADPARARPRAARGSAPWRGTG